MRAIHLLTTTVAIVAPMAVQAAEHTVLFGFDRSNLDAAAIAVIDQAAADYAATGETSVSVVGHADTSGPADYNYRLSERRARAVVDSLVARGVPASAITAAWRGETEPAVASGDGVREPLNRRVEIAISAPTVETPPATVEDVMLGLRFGIGPYVGYNFQENDESWLLGANATLSYNFTPSFSVSAEQALFWNTDSDDDGIGGRTALGAEYAFTGLSVTPYVGANVGYLYADGSFDDDFFAGPELGLRSGPWEVKAAYDFMFDRDADEGVVSVTAGYNFNF
jgi:hypothetical protein